MSRGECLTSNPLFSSPSPCPSPPRSGQALQVPSSPFSRDYVIDLEEGSQHLIRYKTIAPLVASGAVQLI